MEHFNQTTCTGAEIKREFLKEFFNTNVINYDTNNIPYISNKFLYLYGEKNSGKQYYIEEVAKQVFGDDWKSKVYLRIDDGQKYPYKLHAHKVESSVKVILISNSTDNFIKWKALYSNSLLVHFVNDNSEEGFEITENNEAIYKITLVKWHEYNMASLLEFRKKIKDITLNYPEIKDEIYNVAQELIREMNFLNINKSQYLEGFK
jgi:hypothetical protein